MLYFIFSQYLNGTMSGSTGDEKLDKKIEEWLSWDRNERTRAEIQDLVKRSCHNELRKILLDRISFGTAGLRGKMGAGYNCMNDLVVIQAGQGLLKHLEQNHGDVLRESGIVVGYDGRHNSKRYRNYLYYSRYSERTKNSLLSVLISGLINFVDQG